MKKKSSPVRFVILLIAVVAVAGAVTFLVERRLPSNEHMDLRDYFDVTGTEVSLVVNGATLDAHGIRDNGELYLPYRTVAESISPAVYYDEDEALLVHADASGVRKTALDDAGPGSVKRIDGELMLSLSYLEEEIGLTCESFADPDRAVIRTGFTVLRASVVKEGAVRRRAGIKSPILSDLVPGDEVEVLPLEDGIEPEKWTKVFTNDGITGYIDTGCLGEAQETELPHPKAGPSYELHHLDVPVNLTFYQTDVEVMNDSFEDLIAPAQGVNVVSPTWYFLNGPGDIEILSSKTFVDQAHERGLFVWALLNDFGGAIRSREETFAALRATSSREAIIEQILSDVLEKGIDGINIDLENISEEGALAYLEFVREMAAACQEHGLVLSVDTYVPMDYSRYLNRAELGRVCDYVIIMCYDEHFRDSPKSGSVASIGYLTRGIRNAKKEIPSEKVIAAIPFYTRLWHTIDDEPPANRLLDMKETADCIAENGLTVSWDAETAQNYAVKTSSEGTYEIWVEDADSIREKMKVIAEEQIAGVASWRLGNETEDIWSVIAEYL